MPAEPSVVIDRAAGCLLGGALGDALGAPVEFLALPDIYRQHGQVGVTEPPRPALITDDTQMTLFTAEGYLRSFVQGKESGSWHPPHTVWESYRGWLLTQQLAQPQPGVSGLLADSRLYASRSPGLTCLRALTQVEPPSREKPPNGSKGCGGVMRTAPAGFARGPELAYTLGCDLAALTHGDPGGWGPAGALSLIVHLVAVADRSLPEAVDQATGRVLRDDTETAHALASAIIAATEDRRGAGSVERLGQGWIGPEALAIAVYCALANPGPEQFTDALRLAANHSGDSDSTAAITGNILGALHGTAVLPRAWLATLELADVIDRIGRDLGASSMYEPFDESSYAQV
jgi:ADP-ribosylglycohydrolase